MNTKLIKGTQEQFQLNHTIHKKKVHDFILGLEQLLHQYNAHFEVEYDIDYDGNSVKRLVIDFNNGFNFTIFIKKTTRHETIFNNTRIDIPRTDLNGSGSGFL